MIGAEIVGGVESLASGAPNDVCRRNKDPNTRLFFDSSDDRDANEPVLWKFGRFTFEQFLHKTKIFLSFERKNEKLFEGKKFLLNCQLTKAFKNIKKMRVKL